MDLKTCRLITRVLYAACFILILLSLTQEREPIRMGILGVALALAIMITVFRYKFWRCPKCGKMLPKSGKTIGYYVDHQFPCDRRLFPIRTVRRDVSHAFPGMVLFLPYHDTKKELELLLSQLPVLLFSGPFFYSPLILCTVHFHPDFHAGLQVHFHAGNRMGKMQLSRTKLLMGQAQLG